MAKSTINAPPWIGYVLRFAALYNLAWGLFIVFFPEAPFRWSNLEVPNYPAFLQCLGVVIGVYGIGYWIAAADVAAYWPIVLVGLLAKVVWPLVFFFATRPQDSPPNMLGTIFLNDIVWWLPLTAILIQAAKIRESRRTTASGVTLEQALRNAIPQGGSSQESKNLFDLSFEHPLLLLCIRHLGCTFCREALSDLADQRQKVQQAGITPIVVSMASHEQTAELFKRYQLSDMADVSDPERQLFAALELPFGTLSQLVSWSTLWRAVVEGVVFRHGFGGFVGNGLQLSGAFLVRNGRVERAVRHSNPAERTDFTKLSCSVG
jgi:peroxiredoxin